METERGFALVLLAVSLVLSVVVLRPFFTYVALAVLLAYALFPLQRRLGPRIGRRKSALALMLTATVLFVLPFVLLFRVVVQQALALLEGVQSGAIDVVILEDFLTTDLGQDVVRALRSSAGRVVSESFGILGGATTLTIGLTILGFALYYLLVDGDSLVAWACEVTPLSEDVQTELLVDLDRLTNAVLVTQGLIAVVQAILTGLALLVLGFSNVLFWTVFALLLGLLPIVGSTFVWGPAGVYLLATDRPIRGIALLVYGFGLVNLTDNYLRPVVGGRSANLNPAVLVIGIFGGLVVFGLTGLFVGPIVLGFTRTLVNVVAREYAGIRR